MMKLYFLHRKFTKDGMRENGEQIFWKNVEVKFLGNVKNAVINT